MTTTAPTQPSVQPREGQVDARYRASAATWKIAALFCLVICGALILFTSCPRRTIPEIDPTQE